MSKKKTTPTFSDDWANGLLIAEISQRHTMSKDQVVRLRLRLKLEPRLDRSKRCRKENPPLPTPEEIEERAREIRKKWTVGIERTRRGLDDEEEPYEIPQDIQPPDDFDSIWYED